MPSHFDRLGGEPPLRALIERFVARVVGDPMIGFFFASVDRLRLNELEYQFAAAHLGADVVYTGRALDQAHKRHRIFSGQFNRRLRLLDQVLGEQRVPDDIRSAWLAHNESLRAQITVDGTGECGSGS
ncbi:MAG TPA: group 1 truncated hemoglobin [Polyangiaceae bacterium]|nr:group 1 truncated hemoglobin [Polyangiaceae bacterium]